MAKAFRRHHRSLKNSNRHSSIKKTPSNSVIHVIIRSSDNKNRIHANSTILNKKYHQDKSIIHSVSNKIENENENKNLSNMNMSILSNNKSSQNFWASDYSAKIIEKKIDCSSGIASNRRETISKAKQFLSSRSTKVTYYENMTIKQSGKWDLTNEHHRNKRKRKRPLFNRWCGCSRMCAIGSVFATIIFGTIIASILIASLIKPNKQQQQYSKNTTTTTTTTTTVSIGTTTTTTTPGMNNTLVVSENTRINITCSSPTPSINIVYAYYGTQNCTICNCTRMDFTYNVTLYCANSGNPSFCTFQAGNSFFGDTCNFVVKNFWLTYFCS